MSHSLLFIPLIPLSITDSQSFITNSIDPLSAYYFMFLWVVSEREGMSLNCPYKLPDSYVTSSLAFEWEDAL